MAARARRLADNITDPAAAEVLRGMAAEYDAAAEAAEDEPPNNMPMPEQ
jgi:hypothetical protein